MNKTPTLLIALACCGAFLPRAAVSGPTTGTTPWVKMGAFPGADIARLVFDPNNPNTVLFGPEAGSGAIYRSINGGATITRVQVGTIYEAFRAIAFDPKKNSDTVFAASTDFATGRNSTVYESTNGGASWSRLKNQPASAGTANGPLGRVRAMAIDPTGAFLVIGDSKYGIFYSGDLGLTWTNSLRKANIFALAAAPKQPNTLWAGGDDKTAKTGVLWKSTDFGKSWTEVKVPALNQNYGATPLAIAILADGKTILFSWFGSDRNGNTVGGVIASKDGGVTWANSAKGLPVNFNPGNAIVVDPTAATTLYLTTNGLTYPNGLYRSTDSGASWVSIGKLIGGGDFVFTAAARPATGGIPAAVVAADQDLIASTDHGASWTVSAVGTDNGILAGAGDDLLATGGLYAETYNGFFHSTDNGQSWARISDSWKGATVPRAFAVDPVAKTHPVYVATQTAFWRSSNAGKTWVSSALPTTTSTIAQLIADRSISGRVYAVDSNRTVYRSDNGGKSWNAGVGIGGATDGFASLPAVVPDPTQASVLYAGMADGLWKSANSDGRWSKINGIGGLTALAAIAHKGGTEIFAETQRSSPSGLSVAVKRSIGGASFSNATSPYPKDVFSLAAAPNNSAIFAFNVDNSLMRSTDNATSWSLVDGPIESSIIAATAVSVTAKNIYVGDANTNSAYTAPLAALTTGAPAVSPSANRSAFRAGQAPRHIPE